MHFPAPFELGGERQEEQQHRDMEREGEPVWRRMQQQQQQQQQQHQRQPAALSVEAHIGQKLRLIGDQFHGENLQQVGMKPACPLTQRTDAGRQRGGCRFGMRLAEVNCSCSLAISC